MLSFFRLDRFLSQRLKQETQSSWSPSELAQIRHELNRREEERDRRTQEKILQEKNTWDPVIAKARSCALDFGTQCCFISPGSLQRCSNSLNPEFDSLFLCVMHDVQLQPEHPLYFLTSSAIKEALV
jgi:hypothetical protein